VSGRNRNNALWANRHWSSITPAVILDLNTGEQIVVHYSNGIFSSIGLRFTQLKIDGTVGRYGGIGHWRTSRLKLTDAPDGITFTYINSHSNFPDQPRTFYIYEDEVSEEEFLLHMNEQENKKDVQWYAFNAESFISDFSDAWNEYVSFIQ